MYIFSYDFTDTLETDKTGVCLSFTQQKLENKTCPVRATDFCTDR